MSTAVDSTPQAIRAQCIALADTATWPMWLADHRSRARLALESASFPARKSESWKYTGLQPLAASGALSAAAGIGSGHPATDELPAIDAWRVVLVNGRLDAAQSVLPDDGTIEVGGLVGLAASLQPRARELLALGVASRLPFAALNDAALADGLHVRVARGQAASKPLHVVLHADGSRPSTSHTRLLVDLEPQAALTLVEQYTGTMSGLLANSVTAIELGRGARLSHVRLQLQDARQLAIGSLHWRLGQDSECNAVLLMTGGVLKRNDVTADMAGSGAALSLQGVYLVGQDEHADNQVCIEHAVPHATSDQQFRGVIGGNGRAVFNGRIHIHPGARQTRAELVNNNLLLSADAEVDTKPELEIYNDDVQCSHGATVGQLNEAGVFYLQSRGIAKTEAELMLSLGFVNALVDRLPVAGLTDWVRRRCEKWFAVSSGRGRDA